jgi:hypothetical protein
VTPLDVPGCFEREMGCTEVELRAGLRQALSEARLEFEPSSVLAHFDDGTLRVSWFTLSPRRIALLELPRLSVRFQYAGLTPERRYAVQRQFDRVCQRGGG